jgi:hypothetical protein
MLCLQEYAYTMAAAYRSEQRRLLSFLRMADFMMCDTLQTILVQSVSEMLSALEPAPYAGGPQDQQLDSAERPMQSSSGASSAFSSSSGGRSLQAMASILAGSRRARAAAAVAGMQLQPVTAGQHAAAAADAEASAPLGTPTQAAAGQRQPLLEMDVVMNSSCAELSFIPEPEDFQVWTSTLPAYPPACRCVVVETTRWHVRDCQVEALDILCEVVGVPHFTFAAADVEGSACCPNAAAGYQLA